jgi:hypothetical protein
VPYPGATRATRLPAADRPTPTPGQPPSLINPSAAYTVLGSNRIRTVATGTDPHKSFSDVQFDEARWGDYSFAQVDPSGLGIWLATEYIPSAADQDPLDNWGTYVFKVNQFSLGH